MKGTASTKVLRQGHEYVFEIKQEEKSSWDTVGKEGIEKSEIRAAARPGRVGPCMMVLS
jgi:hypothetical protein